jgi:hypothetical protein
MFHRSSVPAKITSVNEGKPTPPPIEDESLSMGFLFAAIVSRRLEEKIEGNSNREATNKKLGYVL